MTDYEHVNHPSHHGGDTPYETIKVIEAWNLDFCLGNAVKYLRRNGRKPGEHFLQEVKKARWYIHRRLEQLATGRCSSHIEARPAGRYDPVLVAATWQLKPRLANAVVYIGHVGSQNTVPARRRVVSEALREVDEFIAFHEAPLPSVPPHLEGKMLSKKILFFGEPASFACDGKCSKAWGRNSRPRIQLSKANVDDFYYPADHELGEAPANPGTTEGSDGKEPGSLNRWCVRECERGVMSEVGEGVVDLSGRLETFEHRVYNIASSDPRDSSE